MKRSTRLKRLLFTVFALTIGLAPMLVRADVAWQERVPPTFYYTPYRALLKSDWEHEMKRLADGETFGDTSPRTGRIYENARAEYKPESLLFWKLYLMIFLATAFGVFALAYCVHPLRCIRSRWKIVLCFIAGIASLFWGIYCTIHVIRIQRIRIQSLATIQLDCVESISRHREGGLCPLEPPVVVSPVLGETYKQYRDRAKQMADEEYDFKAYNMRWFNYKYNRPRRVLKRDVFEGGVK